MVRTYYEVLGVERTASTAEIETAYRQRLKETHPDVTDDPDATDTVQEVIDARDVLTDEAERARYDRLGHETYVSGDPSGTVSAGSSRSGSTSTDTGDASATHGQYYSGSRASHTGSRASYTGSTSSYNGSTSSPGSSTASHTGSTFVDDTGRSRPGSRDATRGEPTGQTDTDRTWPRGSAGRVAQPGDPNAVRWSRLFPPNQSVVLLLAAFVCYPPFVLFSVYPPFPIAFNLVVAACTLLLVGYLISLPEVGILVYGFWGVVTLGAVLTGTLGAITLPGVLAMTATWLPLGLSIVVFRLVRY